MIAQMISLLVDVMAGFFVYLLLARFHFQWLRVPFRNPFGEFVIALTNWVVRPARRVIPSLAGLDLATLLCAWVLQTFAVWALLALRGWGFGDDAGEQFAWIAALACVDLARYSLHLLVFATLAQALLSWVNPHAPAIVVFDAFTRPFLLPLRRRIPPVANIDLSPLILLVLLQLALIPVGHLRSLVERMV